MAARISEWTGLRTCCIVMASTVGGNDIVALANGLCSREESRRGTPDRGNRFNISSGGLTIYSDYSICDIALISAPKLQNRPQWLCGIT
jgi:hypothetical protein